MKSKIINEYLNQFKQNLDSIPQEKLIQHIHKNIHNFNNFEINHYLMKYPYLSTSTFEDIHLLFPIAFKNDSTLMGTALNIAIENGMSHFPVLEKNFYKVPEKSTLLNFCAQLDLDQSFCQVVLHLKNIEENSFAHSFCISTFYKSKKINTIINKISTQDDKINQMSVFLQYLENPRVQHTIFDNFKFNISLYKKYNINVLYQKENDKVYEKLIDFFTSISDQCMYLVDYDKLYSDTFKESENEHKKLDKLVKQLFDFSIYLIDGKVDLLETNSKNETLYQRIEKCFSNLKSHSSYIKNEDVNDLLLKIKEHNFDAQLKNKNKVKKLKL